MRWRCSTRPTRSARPSCAPPPTRIPRWISKTPAPASSTWFPFTRLSPARAMRPSRTASPACATAISKSMWRRWRSRNWSPFRRATAKSHPIPLTWPAFSAKAPSVWRPSPMRPSASPKNAWACTHKRALRLYPGGHARAGHRVATLQRHLLAGPARAVDRLDYLQRLQPFFARHQRPAVVGDGIAEIQELALKGLERNRHRVGCAGGDFLGDWGRIAGIVLHVPCGQLVARDDRGALGAVKFRALRVPRPEGGGRLDHTGGAAGIPHRGVDHIFGFDLVERAKLPHAVQLGYGPGQPAQDIDLVNGLVHERAAALGLPASLDGARIVFRRAVPLHVAIAFQQLAQPAARNRLGEKQAGIVETVLAHHPQQDVAAARGLDHAARGFEIGRDRLLHLHVLARLRADLDGLQTEVGERAHIHVIDLRMAAHRLIGGHELAAVLAGELAARGFEDVRADRQFEADILVDLRVLVRDRAGANHSNSHRN